MSKLWNDTSDIGRWKAEVRPYTYNEGYIVSERILTAGRVRGAGMGPGSCGPPRRPAAARTPALPRLAAPMAWYVDGMKTTIDKAGRVVIPASVRSRVGLRPGTELEVQVEDGAIRLVRVVPRAKLVRVGKRLVARPTADRRHLPAVDVARMIEEERARWPQP